MLPGMDVLQEHLNKTKITPNNDDFIKHLFFSKGITPKQFNEDYFIPEIINIILTETYLRKKESEAYKRRK